MNNPKGTNQPEIHSVCVAASEGGSGFEIRSF